MRCKCFFIAGCVLLFAISSTAQVVRPKIVVGIVIDQMRWDYLYRYNGLYGNDGFKRLLKDGFSAENTFVPYIPTVTGAGHTCIYTGSVPAIHGIVANDWVDRETGVVMYCAKDTTVLPTGCNSLIAGQMSPRNMLTNTIGDELRLATNFRSKVIGISLKDRGGILPAGHSANAAYWFDDVTGKWITSTYYANVLPGWVQSYNSRKVPDSLMRKDWNLLYDKSRYVQSTADDEPYEKMLESDNSRTFPHRYQSIIGSNNYNLFRASPYGTTYSFDFAEQIINNESMGEGSETDMLCLSVSSTDYLGHRFGPNSLEIEDTYLRLDKELADFLSFLDKKFGKDNYLVFLTADHGAPQIGAFLKEKKYYTAGSLNSGTLLKNINAICKRKLGIDSAAKKIYDYDVYLNHKTIMSAGISEKKVKETIVEYLKTVKEVWNAFDMEEMNTVPMPDVLRQKLNNSYYFRRSGDIQFFYKAQYTDYTADGLEHGVWYPYDTHIPCVFYGWGIKPGSTNRETSMADIAPTVTALLKIQMPSGCVGKVITEAIK